MDETKFKAALEEVIKNQRNPNELGGVYKINKDGSLGGKIFDLISPKIDQNGTLMIHTG